MLLLTLRGTPTLYYGDELGMENVPIPPEREQDPFGKNMPGTGQGRDPERTPMQWDDTQLRRLLAPSSRGCRSRPTGRSPTSRPCARTPASMLNLVRALRHSAVSEPALAARRLPDAGDRGRRPGLCPRGRRRAADRGPQSGSGAQGRPLRRGPAARPDSALDQLDRAGEAVGAELALRADEGVVIEVLD